MIVFLVGYWRLNEQGTVYNDTWEVQGIFDNIDKAVAVCTTDGHFIFASELNADYGEQCIPMGDAVQWFPLVDGMPEEFRKMWIGRDE